jgi:hypothetical protein
MSAPTTSIKLSKTIPTAPTGQQNIVFQSDNESPQQSVSASDPAFVGDSGSGGLAGNVPAPPAGSAASGMFLSASGTFEVPSGGGGGTSTTHSESLTDGNGNFIFAATLTTGGDVITVCGIPN